jgi:hypothetical protein
MKKQSDTDFSQSIAETLGEFVYRNFTEHRDELKEELKHISTLLWILIIVTIINIFV